MGRTILSLLVMMRSTTKVLALWTARGQEHLQLQTACQGGVCHCPGILLSYSDCYCTAPSPAGNGIDLIRHLIVFRVLRREGRKEESVQTCLFSSNSPFPFCPCIRKALAWPLHSMHLNSWQTQLFPVANPPTCTHRISYKLTFSVKSKQWAFQSLSRFSLNSKVIIAKYLYLYLPMYFKISTQWLSIAIVFLGCDLSIISTEKYMHLGSVLG